jgi:cytoskeleton protein RodZ
MSLTLGEKLRQAREERGITIMEVSEQTRISPLYLEAIENDDYSPLPGGIFNKGFVKSFAKYVGVDENEALQDYARLITQQTGSEENVEPQTYRPEVLTDDRASSLNPLTIVFAIVILGLMTWGVLSLARYVQDNQTTPVNVNASQANANSANANSAVVNVATPTPEISTDRISVELRAVGEEVWTNYVVDGKSSSPTISPNAPVKLEAQESVRISYHRDKASNISLTLNGREVKPPPPPARGNIVIEINKSNIAEILQSGQINAPGGPATR